MKKLNGKIIAAATLAVLLAAGGAFAWGGRPGFQGRNQGQGMMYGQGQAWNQGPQGQKFANPGQRDGWNRRPMMGCRGQGFSGRHPMMNGRGQNFSGRRPMMNGRGQNFSGRHQAMGGKSSYRGGQRGMWSNIEIPKEIQDKQAEMGKLSIEMRNEMWKKPIDRAKVEELYKKRTELRNELSEWRMKTRLDMIEKLQK